MASIRFSGSTPRSVASVATGLPRTNPVAIPLRSRSGKISFQRTIQSFGSQRPVAVFGLRSNRESQTGSCKTWEGRDRRMKRSLCAQFGQTDSPRTNPHVEQKYAAAAKNAIRLAHGSRFVWEEHQTELADGSVERTIGKRKSGRVCLLPDNVSSLLNFGCANSNMSGSDQSLQFRSSQATHRAIDASRFLCRRQFQERVRISCLPAAIPIFSPRFKYYGPR